MNEHSLSDHNNNEEAMFAAINKAVAEGNTEEINRLMALEGELTESKDTDNPEVSEPEEVVEKTPDETASKEEEETAEPEKAESEQSDDATKTAVTDPEAASAASTSTKDDEIAELKRELHALRSDAGRVRHVQSRMHQLENELRAYRARASNPNEKPTVAKPELPAKLNDKLKNLKEIDPDLAETFEAVIGMVQDTKSSAEQVVSSKLQEDKDQEFFTQQWTQLTTAIPQAPQIFASTEWQQWKDGLTPGQRAMAESGHATDVIRAIHAFAADMRAINGQDASKSGTASEGGDPTKATSVPAQQPAQPNPEVTETRNRKLQTTAAVKTPAAKAIEEFDEDAFFAEAYRNLAKKNHIK